MASPIPKESPAPPDEGLTDLLSEIRLLVPGTLILVAFLIALPFNSGYPAITRLDNAVYVALFICAMIRLIIAQMNNTTYTALSSRLSWYSPN